MQTRMGLGLGLGMTRGGGGASFNFYVDSVNGSDSNSGTSAADALQSLSALSPLLTEGKSARLSGTFRERLVVTADNVRIEGSDPLGRDATLIDCSDEIDPSSWVKTGGRTNVYEVVLDVETSVLAAEWAGIFCNGVRLTGVADLATLDATPGRFYHGTITDVTPITLYIHAPGSTNPSSDGKLYEAAIRVNGIDFFDAEGCTVKHLRGRRNYSSYGSITLGRNCTAENIRCSEGNTHNIYYRSGCTLIDVLADDGHALGQTPTIFIGYEATAPANSRATLIRCRAEQPTYTQFIAGFYVHTGGATNFEQVDYIDCESNNCGSAITGANTLTTNVTGGTLTNYGTGITTSTPTLNVSGVTFGTAAVGGIILLSGVANQAVNISSISANPNTTGNIRSIHSGTTFTITGSTLTAFNTFLLGSAANQNWNISGSTFNPGGRGTTVYQFTGSGLNLASDNNNFGGNLTGDFVIGGTTYGDFTAYRAGTGQDANSVN